MTARALRPLTVLAVVFVIAGLACWATPAIAAEGLTLPGVDKRGSDDPADPVKITAGSWRGSIGPGDRGNRYYEYKRTIDRSTVLISVLASVRTDDSDQVTLAVRTPDGDDCGNNSESGYGEQLLAFSTSTRIGRDPDEVDDECFTSDTLIVELGRGTSDSTSDLPATLTVVEETPVDDFTGLPPSAEETTAFDAPTVSGDAENTPGGTFDDPTDLESGAAATGTVRTGSAVVYRVSVDWGQSLQARLVLPSTTTDADYTTAGVNIFEPRYASGHATEESATLSDSESATATAVAGPVRYLNRVEGGLYVPGFHYIVVYADVLADAQADIEYTLQIEVTGERSGEPDYGTEEPFLVADGRTEAMIGTPGEAASWTSGLAEGWTLAKVATVAGLVLLGLISLGGGVRLLRRR